MTLNTKSARPTFSHEQMKDHKETINFFFRWENLLFLCEKFPLYIFLFPYDIVYFHRSEEKKNISFKVRSPHESLKVSGNKNG
jgi:hypothetical protein